MKCLKLREDLRNGMSIQEGLQKHNLSLQTAVNILQYKQPRDEWPVIKHKSPKRKKKKVNYRKTNEKYIMRRRNTYGVRRSMNGKTRMFGTYNSLEDAIRMRDALELDGWHQTHVDRLCEELGIQRRTGHPASKVRYH